MEVAKLVVPVVGSLIRILASPVWTELALVWGVKNNVQKLQRLLATINAVLEDAERRAISDGAIRLWLKELKDVALEADDIFDEFQTEGLYKLGKKDKVRRFFSSPNALIFRCKIAWKIKDIVRRFDEIADRKMKFQLSERAIVASHPERETFAFPPSEDEIIGREHDKEEIVEWLTKVDDKDHVPVLGIVGLGGVGKTTLANFVFNDEKIKMHFENRRWVHVGEGFNVAEIAKAIIQGDTVTRLEEMRPCIQEKFANKRYLLILDDVWSDDRPKWEQLENLFRGGVSDGKIVITTRNLRVVETTILRKRVYDLACLTDDDGWILFKQRAFGPGRIEETPNLREIGKQIVGKCEGLPLAIKSLGTFVGAVPEETQWLSIRDSHIWNLDLDHTDEIRPALLLSYEHLPPHLKQCFIYCSVFPKGYQIYKSCLIQLWIAQGFVQSEEGRNIEDIGSQYFDYLRSRLFFQDAKKDDFGDVECKMHDLIRGLACYVAKDESSIIEIDYRKKIVPLGCHHLSIIYNCVTLTVSDVSYETRNLRSLFLSRQNIHSRLGIKLEKTDGLKFSKAVSNLTGLRALHLNCALEERSIARVLKRLSHLRFLQLSCRGVEFLPDSITDLRNLETLNLKDCIDLKELPKGMKMMSNLRHIDMGHRYNCRDLGGMPRGICKLTNLQTLSLFHVGMKPSDAAISELQHLNQIKGKLCISGLRNVKNPKDAMEAKLSCKSGLQSLELVFKINPSDASEALDVDVLEKLQPPPNLKSLCICTYQGNKLPKWLTNHLLPNLVHLRLTILPACESLPPLGLMSSLRTLSLYSMGGLKKIGRELYGGESAASAVTTTTISFPSLKEMGLEGAPNLEEWSLPERDAFPSLESLEIYRCPKLRIRGCLPSSLVQLKIGSSDEELLAAGGCLQGLSRVRDLEISGMKASTSGWEGVQYLTGMEDLRIDRCSKLIRLPEGLIRHHFSSLTTLCLHRNHHIESLGGGGELEEEQQQEPPPLFMSLHRLQINFCDGLSVLPEWLGGLASLQYLELWECRNLKMLPDGIQHLARLKHLVIDDCPLLVPRCEREAGEDWHKIAHIPNHSIYQF